jgi:pyruvate,water dikinase
MRRRYVFDLDGTRLPRRAGNKARKLRFLLRHGFRIAPGCVCTWDAYLRYLADDLALVDRLRAQLRPHVEDGGARYVVRSSANVEDGGRHSFAGQFKSVLGVQGPAGVLEAMWAVWASARSPGVVTYLERLGADPRSLRMAVLVQRMIEPAFSGVAFSKNPVTGMDEVVVEAVPGSGEALMKHGVTPHRWVEKWGAWIVRPEGDAIPEALMEEVVAQTKAIARAYGAPVDLEWVHDGASLYWVQLREITSVEQVDVYSNHISKEMLPGLIKPLVWSISGLVNRAQLRLLTELIGRNSIDAERLTHPFFYRAYFNMGLIGQVFERVGLPREGLELLMGGGAGGPDRPRFKPGLRTWLFLPRVLPFAVGRLRRAARFGRRLDPVRARYRRFAAGPAGDASAAEILARIDALWRLNQEVAYYNIVIPIAMQAYSRLLALPLARMGVDFKRFDLTAGLDGLADYDPNVHLRRLHEVYRALGEDARRQVDEADYETFLQLAGVEELQRGVADFLRRFGHLSDSGNDFSVPPWRETPDLILDMVIGYRVPERPEEEQVPFRQLSRARRMVLAPLYRRARRFLLLREAVSSLYTLGYGLFRPYFFALADRLIARDVIDRQEDILYLYLEEVRDAVGGAGGGERDYRALVEGRRREMARCRDVVPPAVIYGDQPLPSAAQAQDRLRGTPTSSGRYRGVVRTVAGIRDFPKVNQGDVLVIPYSDAGWTPLFAKAGAVVAESGGILSHSSIVAREYAIPAVVSVAGAGQLRDGDRVTVDGYTGEVLVHPRTVSDPLSIAKEVQ